MKQITFIALFSIIYNLIFPQYAWAHATKPLYNETNFVVNDLTALPTVYGATLIQGTDILSTLPGKQIRKLIVTAYSSTVDQTDDSPFITANGTHVKDGIIAINTLKFGTQVKFPELFGDKIFTVQDRMAKKNDHKADIWFETREEALKFGVKYTSMVVLDRL